jgi:hypothetical protein
MENSIILEKVVYWLEDMEFESRQGQQIFMFSKHADRLRSPDSLLFSEYWESFLGVKTRGCENDLPSLSSAEFKKELS